MHAERLEQVIAGEDLVDKKQAKRNKMIT